MANADAWNAGWKMGSKTTDKDEKDSAKSSQSGSGDAWSTGWKAGSKAANKNKPASLKKGGKIKKTGIYRLHKGETVVPAGKATGKHLRKRISSKS